MLRREDILRRFAELPLDPERCWLTAGAALVLHGLRTETRDLDIGCTSSLADELERAGYPAERDSDGSRRFALAPDADLSENFGQGFTQRMDGVNVVSLYDILLLKRKLGREKDRADIDALERRLGLR